MEVGIYIRDYIDDPTRPMSEQIEEAAEVCRRARGLGFSVIYSPQHFIGHPTVWLQPMQILSRLAPDAEGMKLMTGILLLAYHNPVDIAEQVVTLDHISNGRFILGLGLGYREKELEAFGTNRRDRVSRFEESIELMKQLWTGEEVTFEGKHWQVHEARLALTPVQKPHPPIWIAAQSTGAVRRAARIADACLLGPQPSWADFHSLATQYNEAVAERGGAKGLLGANRSIAIARDRETAITEATVAGQAKAGMYAGFNMQENTTVDLGLGGPRELAEWAVVGSPEDCAERISQSVEEDGLEYIGLGCLNLPKGFEARLEYLQLVSEELLPRLP
ncbi:MAG: LLM class flavin-dependent oxidoreductase [Chloroflexi bacterium]|nr:LLM class flavin-dependent oxidoreductase [Chloroflexota bacterium]MCI0781415.1 LLM class flavin-dependent oxidoreductase [Chloroflexota bacterium]MCI0858513.1 LLM class flavin-dependent oxidoreductase [Chloroflexota bacterium]MCI0867989.1 LLM class flavin-dependent oxidoreductase [Chloroflexota bacterium]